MPRAPNRARTDTDEAVEKRRRRPRRRSSRCRRAPRRRATRGSSRPARAARVRRRSRDAMAATTGAKVLSARRPWVGSPTRRRASTRRAPLAAQACGVGLSCLALPSPTKRRGSRSCSPVQPSNRSAPSLGRPRKDWAPTLLDATPAQSDGLALERGAAWGISWPSARRIRPRRERRADRIGADDGVAVGAAPRSHSALSAPEGRNRRLRSSGSAPARPVRSARRRAKRRRPAAWAAFFGQPSGAAITTVAFALLWFTALTPHAPVLLAAPDAARRRSRSRPFARRRSRRRRRVRGGRRRPHRNAAGANDDHI